MCPHVLDFTIGLLFVSKLSKFGVLRYPFAPFLTRFCRSIHLFSLILAQNRHYYWTHVDIVQRTRAVKCVKVVKVRLLLGGPGITFALCGSHPRVLYLLIPSFYKMNLGLFS